MSKQQGVVFGFELVGKWGNGPEAPTSIYYIGRTRQKVLLRDDVNAAQDLQKEMIRDRLKFRGLNKPLAMLFWARTDCVRQTWWDLTDYLKNSINFGDVSGDDPFPHIRQQLYIGDNFYMFGPQVTLSELREYFKEHLRSRAVFTGDDVELMSAPATPQVHHVSRM